MGDLKCSNISGTYCMFRIIIFWESTHLFKKKVCEQDDWTWWLNLSLLSANMFFSEKQSPKYFPTYFLESWRRILFLSETTLRYTQSHAVQPALTVVGGCVVIMNLAMDWGPCYRNIDDQWGLFRRWFRSETGQ